MKIIVEGTPEEFARLIVTATEIIGDDDAEDEFEDATEEMTPADITKQKFLNIMVNAAKEFYEAVHKS